MRSSASERFWKCHAALPEDVRRQAKDAYTLFEKAPYPPGLHFKRVHSSRPIFSVRISLDYRAAGIVEADEITWFWIGSHTDYDSLLRRLRGA